MHHVFVTKLLGANVVSLLVCYHVDVHLYCNQNLVTHL